MPSIELYISGVLADISADSSIPLSFQVNDIADLKDRQSTYSNSIKLPKTANNCLIWGNAQSDAFTQTQPYRRLPCLLVIDGSQLIINGSIQLLRSNDSFECQIISGLVGIADKLTVKTYDKYRNAYSLSDAKLIDLDWSDIADFTPTIDYIASNQAMFPAIDFGGTLSNTSVINSTYLRPGVYLSQIMDRIQKYTGYQFLGGASYVAGLNDFIPFGEISLKDRFGQDYKEDNQPISFAQNLPDFTLKDILKDYMQRYFLTPFVDNYKMTVTFKSYDDIYNNIPNAYDWTKKFVNGGNEDTFSFSSYAQTNNLSFVASEDDVERGNSFFNVDNTTLQPSKDILTSIYAGAVNIKAIGNYDVASIPAFNTPPQGYNSPFNIDLKPRIVKILGAPGTFSLTDGQQQRSLNNGISYGYFAGWTYYLTNYGQGLLKLLNKCRVCKRNAVLNVTDVQNIDYFTPVFDRRESKYYYINKIDSYIAGKAVAVTLVRL
jgi:hypothetical protein